MGKILVTGAAGQLGSEIRHISESYPYEFLFTDATKLDVTDRELVWRFFQSNEIDAVINCAAYTAVDRAESEVERADQVNHLAPKYLAEAVKEFKAKFVHVSTDYVFDGESFRPYSEETVPNPKSIYGLSKLKGEEAVLQLGLVNSVIIRTSWVYSSFGNNFVKTIRRLGIERPEVSVVVDQVGTPTYARDLAVCILDILPRLENAKTELYHYSNEGVCSWYDFAVAIMEASRLECKVNAIPSTQYPTPVKRPFYSVLDKSKIKADFGVQIRHWGDALNQCIQQLT